METFGQNLRRISKLFEDHKKEDDEKNQHWKKIDFV